MVSVRHAWQRRPKSAIANNLGCIRIPLTDILLKLAYKSAGPHQQRRFRGQSEDKKIVSVQSELLEHLLDICVATFVVRQTAWFGDMFRKPCWRKGSMYRKDIEKDAYKKATHVAM